jgi:hypothetical protein
MKTNVAERLSGVRLDCGWHDQKLSAAIPPQSSILSLSAQMIACQTGKSHPAPELVKSDPSPHMCTWSQLWLIWPFLLWGLLIVVCYSIGYSLLSVINGPVALFNIVNYVNLAVKQNLYFIQVGNRLRFV